MDDSESWFANRSSKRNSLIGNRTSFFFRQSVHSLKRRQLKRPDQQRLGGVGLITNSLEALFHQEGGELIRGTQEFASSVQETYSALQGRDKADFALIR